jgi:hypothetical protein
MTQTIQQVYGLSRSTRNTNTTFLLKPGRVGLEVELEGMYQVNHYEDNLEYWRIIGEDSLRDCGVEFVTRFDGLEGTDVIEALKELEVYLRNKAPKATWRCSNHVHLDVRDLTVHQAKRVILLSILSEDVLYNSSGAHRYDSNFCMPMSQAEGLIETLSRYWGIDNNFFYDVQAAWSKYAGVNLIPTAGMGSIEFRNSEPKYQRGQLLRLANRYLALKETAIATSSISDEDFINAFDIDALKSMFIGCLPQGYVFPSPEEVEDKKLLALDVIKLADIQRVTVSGIADRGKAMVLVPSGRTEMEELSGYLPHGTAIPGVFNACEMAFIHLHMSFTAIRRRLTTDSYNELSRFYNVYPEAKYPNFYN